MHLYHLTPTANLASILENGLSPAMSREADSRARSIYLASDAHHALGYADHHGEGHAEHLLLRVEASALDAAALGPDDVDLPDLLEQEDDDREWSEVGWQESLEVSGQCTCSAVIPAEALDVYCAKSRTWQGLIDYSAGRDPAAVMRAQDPWAMEAKTNKKAYHLPMLSDPELWAMEGVADERDLQSLVSDLQGISDLHLSGMRVKYEVDTILDRPDLHRLVIDRLQAAQDAWTATNYPHVEALSEQLRAAVMAGYGMDAATLVLHLRDFIAQGGYGHPWYDGEEMLEVFLKKRNDDGQTPLPDPELKGQFAAAGLDDAKAVGVLMRFIEAGGPKVQDNWRRELQLHIEAEIEAVADASAPKL